MSSDKANDKANNKLSYAHTELELVKICLKKCHFIKNMDKVFM